MSSRLIGVFGPLKKVSNKLCVPRKGGNMKINTACTCIIHYVIVNDLGLVEYQK